LIQISQFQFRLLDGEIIWRLVYSLFVWLILTLYGLYLAVKGLEREVY
jgi:hypothetical protein